MANTYPTTQLPPGSTESQGGADPQDLLDILACVKP